MFNSTIHSNELNVRRIKCAMSSPSKFLNYNFTENQKLVSCPYNKAHQMLQHRLANHLTKCRRSHSTGGLAECIFDITHIYPIDKIEEHQRNCPDRVIVELAMGARASELNAEAVSAATSPKPLKDEDPVDIPTAGTYNPMKKVLSTNVLRTIQHLTPSERKELRDCEYARLAENRTKSKKV